MRKQMSRFDPVIFDCDGVLVASEAVANEVLAEILGGYGLALSGPEARATFVGMSVEDVRLSANARYGLAMREDWSVAYYADLIPALGARVEPIDGVHDVVAGLTDLQVPFCVASQGPPEKMKATLTRTGLWTAFGDRAYSAKAIRRPKPAPDLFLHAAQAQGVPPEKCAVIEDSVVGVTAGIAAGMTVFAYCPPADATAMERLVAIPFHGMEDLPGNLGLE
jgi:HAD superfamily hydrolase (TIGR01509 family)